MPDNTVTVNTKTTPAAINFSKTFNVAVPFIDRHLEKGRGEKIANCSVDRFCHAATGACVKTRRNPYHIVLTAPAPAAVRRRVPTAAAEKTRPVAAGIRRLPGAEERL